MNLSTKTQNIKISSNLVKIWHCHGVDRRTPAPLKRHPSEYCWRHRPVVRLASPSSLIGWLLIGAPAPQRNLGSPARAMPRPRSPTSSKTPAPKRPNTPGIERRARPWAPKPQRPSTSGIKDNGEAWGGLGFVDHRGGSCFYIN